MHKFSVSLENTANIDPHSTFTSTLLIVKMVAVKVKHGAI